MIRVGVLPHLVFSLVVLLVSGCQRLSEEWVDPELESRYDFLIAEKAVEHGLEPELLKAVIWRESRFRSHRIGQKGELGLMQLMGPAVEDWARAHKCPVPTDEEVMAPELNIEIGAWYLAWCGRRFSDTLEPNDVLRLAVYNAGYGRVRDKWLPPEGSRRRSLQVSDISFPMTRDYITKIMDRAAHYRTQRDF